MGRVKTGDGTTADKFWMDWESENKYKEAEFSVHLRGLTTLIFVYESSRHWH